MENDSLIEKKEKKIKNRNLDFIYISFIWVVSFLV